ncbi:MAG: amidohydrolase family protein [Maricaulis sp.]|jgi:imidazolonepropionase-like amidohydrolase|uniref:metal-dependent hydrolase family protein n=1 Tax=Maricaulis sp. TaxID=1486257 RepID=UPI00260975C9|nr:amidohydrolase family protein [Maricaulis sp.]MDM7983851.1 amidohydrolase family protein [Maricaulis sp.]
MIKTILAAGIAAIGLSAAYAQNEAPLTVIHAGQLLAVPGEEPASQQSILVRNGRIESVQAGYVTPDGAEIIDLSDQFVLPGLIDSHVHLQGELSPSGRLDTVTLSSADNALDAARHARTTLMAGFTSAQEVGGQLEASIALRNAIRDGDVIGPRLRVSGPAVTPTGGHGDINGYSTEVMDLLSSRAACNGPADCRRAVRELVRAGVDVIKITATGGVLSNTAAGVEQQFFDDELEAIVEAARMMGRRVTAHAHGESGIDSFLEAGGASIEHGTYLDRDSIRLFRRNGAYLVPTVLAGVTVSEIAETADWMTPPIRAKSRMVGPQMLAMARRAHEGGVMIAFGTDSGVSRHGLNAREFQLLVEAGMTEMEAIVTATVNAADHIEMADDIGTIEAGKFADIIAVDGNPLEDISELMDVDFVMQGGRVHKNQ